MATISALLTSKMCISPIPLSLTTKTTNIHLPKNPNSLGMLIECSSRPQKKATAHHRKTRPKKSAPWDIRRGPAVYPPLPQMPSEWSFLVEDVIEGGVGEETKEAALVEAA